MDRFELVDEKGDSAYIGDRDRRRLYVVKVPKNMVAPWQIAPDKKRRGINILGHYVNILSPKVSSIPVDEHGLLIAATSDKKGLKRIEPKRIKLSTQEHLQSCPTIIVSDLTKQRRLWRCVDLVHDKEHPHTRLAFKYALDSRFERGVWNELSLLGVMPDHPHIVPLHSLVLNTDDYDSSQQYIMGLTTDFYPGGSLDYVLGHMTSLGLSDKDAEPFKFKWLKQLVSAVDVLNLEWGIAHMDIDTRNILLDIETDSVKLCDFGEAISLSTKTQAAMNYSQGEPDWMVSFRMEDVASLCEMVYEIITHDTSHRDLVLHNSPDILFNQKYWPLKGKLDCEVSMIRKYLRDWWRRRVDIYLEETEPSDPLDILPMQPESPKLRARHQPDTGI